MITPRLKYLELRVVRMRLIEIQSILENNLYENANQEASLIHERDYLEDKENQLVNEE